MRNSSLTLLATCGLAAVASAAAPVRKPASEANYWMSAETVSGLATGQPNGEARNLQLQLGTTIRPTAAPAAEHLPPSALGAGARLPLTSPRKPDSLGAAASSAAADPSTMKGRMVIFWGCGEQARSGQPQIVDLAGIATGKAGVLAGLSAAAMSPPAPGRQASYGEWPNSDGRTAVPARGSLVGEHVVQGNYTPELRFSLAQSDDFLSALQPRTTTLPSGAVRISWAAVPRARGTFAAVMGAAQDGTIVLWTSSEVKLAGMTLPDYLAPAEITRLLAAKALLAPQTTECTVPSEVIKAGGMTLQMTAFGPETNLRSPGDGSRWAVKLRTKSTHTGMLVSPAVASTAQADGAEQTPQAPRAGRKRGVLRGLGKIMGVPPLP
jgi:hypothetical protein